MIKKFLILTILVSQFACFSNWKELSNQRNKAKSDLKTICDNIRVPNEFEKLNTEDTAGIKKVALFRRYKSKDSCNKTKDYFFEYFIDKGWDRSRMKSEQTGGGIETIEFMFPKDEYDITVACQNDVPDYEEKQIIISCTWGL